MPLKPEKRLCMVPACKASSKDFPNRVFLAVPENKKREWMVSVGAESVYTRNTTKRFYCCEEHFDTKRDFDGYDFYKQFGGRLKFHDYAYPFKNLGDIPEIPEPTAINYLATPPVVVVQTEPIAEIELNEQSSKEDKKKDDERTFTDPLFTSEKDPLFNAKMDDDEDEAKFDATECQLNDLIQSASVDANVKCEEIVVKPELLYIKEEPVEESEDFNNDSSDVDFSDRDDTNEEQNIKTKNDSKEETKDEPDYESSTDTEDNKQDSDEYVPKKTKHQCPDCGNYYSSATWLKHHKKIFHTEGKAVLRKKKKPKPKPFPCEVCKKPFETLFRKNRHLTTHNHDPNRVKSITCRKCSERFKNTEAYKAHKWIHEKTFECDICHKSFASNYLLKSHYPIHSEAKPFQCDRCSRSFKRLSTLRTHSYTHETEKKYICETCGKRFHAPYLVKMHILNSHVKANNYMCSECSKRFPTTSALNIHINGHHSEINPYKCMTCEKTFNRPSALARHRKLHIGNNDFFCKQCTKRFVQSDDLQEHIKDVHSGKSFKCELCSFTFNTEKKLKKHMRSHKKSVERVIERCVDCHQPFVDHQKLIRHLEIFHNPNNPFRCELCLKRFSHQSALGRHMKLLHIDQKKTFKCEECEQIFSQLYHLKTHTINLHNPDNLFKCPTCRQTFATQVLLDKHVVRVHETEKTVLCEYCNKAFGKRDGLRRHIRKFHETTADSIRTGGNDRSDSDSGISDSCGGSTDSNDGTSESDSGSSDSDGTSLRESTSRKNRLSLSTRVEEYMDTSVEVAIRIRPQKSLESIVRGTCVTVTPHKPEIVFDTDIKFTFDLVFESTSKQSDIYDRAIQKLVEKSLKGYNATVLAYGQTGSGKTYTIGTGFKMNMSESDEGIIPRAIKQLFSSIEIQPYDGTSGWTDFKFSISAQFIEIYNDEIIDLLNPNKKSKEYKIHEDSSGSIYVTGVTIQQLKCPSDALRCLHKGVLARSTGTTKLNAHSSRSHAIFTIMFCRHRLTSAEDSDIPEEGLETLTSKFHFVDLAGAEQLKRTGATGHRVREGISINVGLFALGNVISALADKSKKATHIPYRNSKLTRLLQDSLGGNSNTLMIACISPNERDYMESLNTLRYANRAKNIKNHVEINQNQSSQMISLLRNEIAKLQLELTEYKQGKVNNLSGLDVNGHSTLIADNQRLRRRIKSLEAVINKLTKDWSESTSQSSDLLNGYLQEIEKLHTLLPNIDEVSYPLDSNEEPDENTKEDPKPDKRSTWWKCGCCSSRK